MEINQMGAINFNIRMDESLKERAFPVIESYGMTPAQAVKLFFNQIAATQTIPLSFEHNARIPNIATRRAIEEAEADWKAGRLKAYSSLEEMAKDIQEFEE